MKIYVRGDFVDLEAPIYMEEDQLIKFTDFLRHLLKDEIEIQEVKEKERFANRSERQQRKWTFEELFDLLNPNLSTSELSKKLNRTTFGIAMHRAHFVPNFISWAKSKGYDAPKITKTLIKEFMEEQDENIER